MILCFAIYLAAKTLELSVHNNVQKTFWHVNENINFKLGITTTICEEVEKFEEFFNKKETTYSFQKLTEITVQRR